MVVGLPDGLGPIAALYYRAMLTRCLDGCETPINVIIEI